LILFEPITNVHNAYIAQTIRILYPALIDSSGGVLISDIDMLPGNSKFFTKNIQNIDNDKFISYRGGEKKEIYMCYNLATPNIWRDVSKITSLDKIKEYLSLKYKKEYDGIHGGKGWSADQEILYQMIYNWENQQNFVCLNDLTTKFSRLDWHQHNYELSKFKHLSNLPFSDIHLYAHCCTWNSETIKEITKTLFL
jgi:hypothetical protein